MLRSFRIFLESSRRTVFSGFTIWQMDRLPARLKSMPHAAVSISVSCCKKRSIAWLASRLALSRSAALWIVQNMSLESRQGVGRTVSCSTVTLTVTAPAASHSADENLAIPHNSMKIPHGEQRSRHKNRQVQRSVF